MIDYKVADKETAKIEKKFIGNVTKAYQVALDDIGQRLDTLYGKYSVDGKLSIETMSVADRNKVSRLKNQYSLIEKDIGKVTSGLSSQIEDTVGDVYKINYDDGVRMIGVEAGQSYAFDMINRQAVYKASVSDLGKLALESNEIAIKQNLKRSITTSIVQGESIQTMKKRIQNDLETNANNAVRIARTETGRVMNEARYDLMGEAEKAGIVMDKVWLAKDDDRTRPSHRAMNGERVAIDKKFSNGLMKPLDPSGPASEVINCRCTMYNEINSIDGIPFDELAKDPSENTPKTNPVSKAKQTVESAKQNEIVNPKSRKESMDLFKKYGIDTKNIPSNIDDDILRDYSVGMQKFYNEFPETKGFVKGINGVDINGTVGRFNPNDMYISVNKTFMSQDYELFSHNMKDNIRGGFHPKGASIESIFTHEQAHMLELTIVNDETISGATSMWNNHIVAESLIDKTLIRMGAKSAEEAFLITKKVGKYGMVNKSELFAEAISDAVSNKKNALEFSKQLMITVKERLALIK